MREIVRAEAWKGFREIVEELGGDPGEILAAARVDESALVMPDRYLPLRSLVDSIEIAATRLGRPDFGLLSGTRTSISMLGALTIAASNATSGREGWEVVGRYLHIHNPALTAMITPVPGTTCDLVSMELQSRTHQSASQYLERGVGVIHAALRGLCGAKYRPAEARFRNQQISPIDVYRRTLGLTPTFGEKALGIVVERAILDAPQPGRNTDLRALTEMYLQSLGTPRGVAFSLRVAGLVRGLLSNGDCSSEQAALALGVHERTLQRRLNAEETTFEQIKDDVRKELAEDLLAQPSVSLSHIAYTLSYADSSTFSRSARRWFGMPPRAYRAKLLAAPRHSLPNAPRSRTKAWEAQVLTRGEHSLTHRRSGRGSNRV